MTGLTQFILTRPTIVSSLLRESRHGENQAPASSAAHLPLLASLESMAELFVRYVDYNCTEAEAILFDEHKVGWLLLLLSRTILRNRSPCMLTCLLLLCSFQSVFVAWSQERRCPLGLDIIQAQLILCTYLHEALPPVVVQQDPTKEPCCCWWARLRDMWFIPAAVAGGVVPTMPEMSPYVMPTMPPSSDAGLVFAPADPAAGGSCAARPVLSVDLRSALIRTNQPAIVQGGEWPFL